MTTRRTVLLGGLGVAGLAATGAAGYATAGLPVVQRQLGACDVAPRLAPRDGVVAYGRFDSRHRGPGVEYGVAGPVADGVPVCLLLHGSSWTARAAFETLRYHDYLAEAVRGRGIPPFVLAAVDGGRLWWRGAALAMVFEEFLPLLAAKGLRTERLGVLGASMGGYGALLFAQTYPERFAAAVALSPALEADEGAPPPAGTNVWAGATRLAAVPTQVYCGEQDQLAPSVRRFVGRAPVQSFFSRGCHGDNFWMGTAPQQLDFLGRTLSAAR